MGLALRVMAAVVVWLAAVGHLTGVAHFALISHHVCAAHGELTHEDSRHSHAALGAAAAQNGAPSVAPGADAEDEHEHCSVLARRQEQATAERAALAVLAPPALPTSTLVHIEVPAHRGQPLLALAPKTSPPV